MLHCKSESFFLHQSRDWWEDVATTVTVMVFSKVGTELLFVWHLIEFVTNVSGWLIDADHVRKVNFQIYQTHYEFFSW